MNLRSGFAASSWNGVSDRGSKGIGDLEGGQPNLDDCVENETDIGHLDGLVCAIVVLVNGL